MTSFFDKSQPQGTDWHTWLQQQPPAPPAAPVEGDATVTIRLSITLSKDDAQALMEYLAPYDQFARAFAVHVEQLLNEGVGMAPEVFPLECVPINSRGKTK